VLVDIYGVGVLITGKSGVGKSETALELVKRGEQRHDIYNAEPPDFEQMLNQIRRVPDKGILILLP
jgi:serine kinase of HPr protein (carbohydrate metabolism regulator)